MKSTVITVISLSPTLGTFLKENDLLEYIALANFRRHESIKVVLEPGVNVACGASKSGKSTLIRALRWIAFNRPTGNSILRWGAETVKAKLGVDGRTVLRKRGPSTNIYKLDDQVPHKSFGTDVPDDVARLLNVSPTFNFSGQHSAPFLFNLTPGDAARELNAVVNLDKIDEVLGHLASEVRRTNAAVTVGEQRLAAAEDKARSLGWVEAVNVALRKTEEAAEEVQSVVDELEIVESMVDKVRQLTNKLATLETEMSKVTAETDKVDAAIAKADAALTALRMAERVVDQVRRVAWSFGKADRAATLAEADAAELSAGRCPLCGVVGAKKERKKLAVA